jgi:hypothetical protein
VIRNLEARLRISPLPAVNTTEKPKRPKSNPFELYLVSLGEPPNDLKELRQRFLDAKYNYDRDEALRNEWEQRTKDAQLQYTLEKKQLFKRRSQAAREFYELLKQKIAK